ncbi:MAG: ABC transporter substrate-binding protein [bacterium]|nr:ABC transporter substrate-binding protein [bacterium]
MAVNRRLLLWLVKAYLKKWGKVILLSFVAGLIVFLTLLSTSRFLLHLLPLERRVSIGYIGAYRIDGLPKDLQQKLSRGLTKVGADGSVSANASSSWQIKDDGKTYVFTLRDDVYYSDGQKLTARSVPYEFRGVKKEVLGNRTVAFHLQDKYAPFLVTASRPIIRKGFVGLGEYGIQNVELNGEFVRTLSLVSKKNKLLVEKYIFYPSEEALKIAFSLGEVKKAVGLSDDTFINTQFSNFKDVSVLKSTDKDLLVTLFFDNRDPVLSDPKLRSGLSYAIPESFSQGERSFLPYSPTFQYASKEGIEKHQDFTHASLLLSPEKNASPGSHLTLTLKTLSKYRQTAEAIAEAWKKVNVETTIEEVDGRPDSFQVYLGDFSIPRDPDQYSLWHSTSANNITHFKNTRIDKLLEDGRKTTVLKERKDIYNDFQKYLLADSPAAFLYFPYEYTVSRNGN